MAVGRRRPDTGFTMNTPPNDLPVPQDPQDPTPAGDESPESERREIERRANQPWPEAMREDFRMLEFLAGIEVHDSDWDAWQDTVEAQKKP